MLSHMETECCHTWWLNVVIHGDWILSYMENEWCHTWRLNVVIHGDWVLLYMENEWYHTWTLNATIYGDWISDLSMYDSTQSLCTTAFNFHVRQHSFSMYGSTGKVVESVMQVWHTQSTAAIIRQTQQDGRSSWGGEVGDRRRSSENS